MNSTVGYLLLSWLELMCGTLLYKRAVTDGDPDRVVALVIDESSLVHTGVPYNQPPFQVL